MVCLDRCWSVVLGGRRDGVCRLMGIRMWWDIVIFSNENGICSVGVIRVN